MKAVQQLNDASTYRILPKNPTNDFARQLSHFLDCGWEMGVLTTKMVEYLFVNDSVIPVYLRHEGKDSNPFGQASLVQGLGKPDYAGQARNTPDLNGGGRKVPSCGV